MEANDVLADDVEIGRLEFPVTLGIRVRIADARQIVRQRIDPDVHDMAWAAGNGDAPVKARARDRQVRQASSDEAHHFIATAVGLDELRVRLIMRQKQVGIGGKAEEPRSAEHTSELQSLMRTPYAVFCLKKKKS